MFLLNFFNWTLNKIKSFLEFINNIQFIIIIIILIVLYHTLLYFLRDRKYIKAVRNNKDPDTITIDDLIDFPLVNIIVPAWKEREVFRECLISITKLTYPKLNVIVNAGGNEKTLKIAYSFKKYKNFIILHQKGGGRRPSLGKIKALNDCLPYVSKGLIYMVDADVCFTDEVLIRMVYPLINQDEKVVAGGIKPFESIKNKDLIKYFLFNRNLNFRNKFSRYGSGAISGANTCMKYEVIKSIGRFTEDNVYAEDVSRGEDIHSKGFKIYKLNDYRGRMYCEYPDKIFAWLHQKIRWNENFLIHSYRTNKLKLFRFVLLFIVSFYLIIFPIFLVINVQLFLIGMYLLIFLYLLKIRKLIFFKFTTGKEFTPNFKPIFFIKSLFYIYLEKLATLIIPFHLIYFRKYLRRIGDST